MLTWGTASRQSLLTPARLKWQPQRSAGSLAALQHASQLRTPAAVLQVWRQAPGPAASGSGSTGQPASRPEVQQPAAPSSPPNTSDQQQAHKRWQQAYNQVLAFQQAHGRLPRTNASKAEPLLEGERKLGRWCVVQYWRKDGSKGQPLSAEEKAALQAIPGWNWGPKDWWQWLREVEVFVAQHERLPRQSGSKSQPYALREKELGMWCHRQRWRCKQQSQLPLTAEQQSALAAIPGWFWEQWQVQDWEQQRQRVLAFQQQYGRLPRLQGSSSQPLLENEGRLGRWCKSQRERYKGQQQRPLSPAQQSALATIPGWFWEQFQRQDWEQQRQRVVAFQQQHGRLPRLQGSSSQPLVEIEGRLGRWCNTQRERCKGQQQPVLSPERQAALAAIPGWFWEQRHLQDWEQQYQQIVAFQQQHGRLPRQVGSSSQPLVEIEGQLGSWCNSQRQRWKGRQQSPLSHQQEAALAAIPGWFWEQCKRQDWEQQFQRIVAFQQQHGRLPRQVGCSSQPLVESERQLGVWCRSQRQRGRNSGRRGPLPPEQHAALERIPGWAWGKARG